MPADEPPKDVDDATWEEMPGTIKRSPPKAQRTWAKAHDGAVETYGEGEAGYLGNLEDEQETARQGDLEEAGMMVLYGVSLTARRLR